MNRSGIVIPGTTSCFSRSLKLSAPGSGPLPLNTSRAPEIAAPAVVAASAQDIDRLLEWRPRLLDFDSTPLADVVAEFNRRNPTRLALGDDDLRTLPIVASIRSDNVEGFVRLLEATMGLRAERRDDGDIVLRRSR